MSYSHDLYNREHWAKVEHEQRIQEHINRTPDQRRDYRQKLDEMFAEWSNNRLRFGLAYYDGLLIREAAINEAEKRLSDHLEP